MGGTERKRLKFGLSGKQKKGSHHHINNCVKKAMSMNGRRSKKERARIENGRKR